MENPPALETQPLSVKDWVLTLIIGMISPVNIIMWIVWATSADTHPSKKNYAKASLIVLGVVVAMAVVALLVFGLIFGLAAAGMHSAPQ
ncbi:hypothetical protein BH09VER1_BH09VER1_07110 [soil metagenome]